MIRKILKTLCILSVIFIIPVSAQNNNVIDEVIWIVGDEPILKSEVEEERLRMQYEGESIVGDPYCFIPEQIALQKLFLHQAKLDSIEVQEQAVFQRVDEMINIYISRIGSKEKMEEYLRKNSAEIRDELLTRVRDNAIEEQMKYHLTQNVKSTPSEVRKFYNSLPQDSIPFIPTQVEVQILTFKPEIAQSEIDNVKSKLRDFTDRINKGDASFSTLALLYSEDPGSARLGGELGLKTKGEFVPEF